MLTTLPREIHYLIIDYLQGIDILYLSLANIYFYNFLNPFRILALKTSNVHLIWPTLALGQRVVKKETAGFLKSITDWEFHFNEIVIDATQLSIVKSYLPPTRLLHVKIDSNTTVEELDIIRDCNITHLSILNRISDKRVVQELLECRWKNLKVLEFCDYGLIDWKRFSERFRAFSVERLTVRTTFNVETISYFSIASCKTFISNLNLSGCQLNDQIVSILSDYLPEFKVLDRLYMEVNEISNDGAVSIAKRLPGSSVTCLFLRNNKIGFKGLEAISKSLPKSKLKVLGIDNNSFANDDYYILFDHIPNSPLEQCALYISEDRTLKSIAENISLSNIKTIKFNLDSVYLEQFLVSATKSKLTSLILYGKYNANSECILSKFINQLPVQHLYLSEIKMSKASIEKIFSRLAFTSSITHLSLLGWMDDDGFKAMVNHLPHTNIRGLFVQSTITDHSLLSLAKIVSQTQLRELHIMFGNITGEAIKKFVEQVKSSLLRKVDFRGISVEKRVAKEIKRIGPDWMQINLE
ncbi:hypothetical protein HDV01_007090 [Terramyces sp. JEL0728]|nr:hypothetical protein HDV01_007090 [Terramyces sp. JEL0728]